MVNEMEYDGKVELKMSEQEFKSSKVYPLKVEWIRCPSININFINKPYFLTTYSNDKYGKVFERRLYKKELKEQGFSQKIYHYIDRANSKNEKR